MLNKKIDCPCKRIQCERIAAKEDRKNTRAVERNR